LGRRDLCIGVGRGFDMKKCAKVCSTRECKYRLWARPNRFCKHCLMPCTTPYLLEDARGGQESPFGRRIFPRDSQTGSFILFQRRDSSLLAAHLILTQVASRRAEWLRMKSECGKGSSRPGSVTVVDVCRALPHFLLVRLFWTQPAFGVLRKQPPQLHQGKIYGAEGARQGTPGFSLMT
jgi:hypothetical protein